MRPHRTRPRTLAVLGTILTLGACSEPVAGTATVERVSSVASLGGPADLQRTLAAVRAATAKYHDAEAAAAAGYRQASPCESTAAGAMGFHYANGALMGIRGTRGTPPLLWGVDAVVDPLQPELLLYEPHENGGVRLVGVEYLVFAAPWDALHDDPPTLAGVPFDYNPAGSHGFEAHYELHVWLWRNNPDGMFEAWNPMVSCD